MVLKIVAGLVGVLALIVVYVLLRMPAVFVVRRSISIRAPLAKVFPYLSQSRLIQTWNPFVLSDPNAKVQFSGPEEGVGSTWSWEGPKAGQGSATITGVEPSQRVSLRLDFEKPFKATNFGEYSILSEGNSCEVTWLVNEVSFVPRAMSTLMNLDKVIGSEFEKGLLQLKAQTEAPQTGS